MGLLPLVALALILFPDLRPALGPHTLEALIWTVPVFASLALFAWAGFVDTAPRP